jgi:hypothetical protein
MSYSREHYLKNKDKIIANKKYRKKLNPEKTRAQRKKWDIKYYSNERNWLRDSWGRARKRSRNKGIIFNITFEYLLQAWNIHKEKYGYKCRYTGETMTFIRGKGKITPTNLSIDRLSNHEGYIEGNIIFCTASFNSKKGSLSVEDCKNIIKVHEDEISFKTLSKT